MESPLPTKRHRLTKTVENKKKEVEKPEKPPTTNESITHDLIIIPLHPTLILSLLPLKSPQPKTNLLSHIELVEDENFGVDDFEKIDELNGLGSDLITLHPTT